MGSAHSGHFDKLPCEADILHAHTVLDAQKILTQESFDFILGVFPFEDENWSDFVQKMIGNFNIPFINPRDYNRKVSG